MKKLMMLATLFLIATPVLADGHKNSNQLMNKDECYELKDGITELLMISDYSTIYDVWCD